MIDSPCYKTWHVETSKSTPTHQDIHLAPGESIGIIVADRRLVVSVDEWGRCTTKVQKKAYIWEDIDE